MKDEDYGFTLVITNDPDHGRVKEYRKVFDELDKLGVKITTACFCTIKDDGSGLAKHCRKGETHTLSDPEYRELMVELKSQGHEIAYHGYSQCSDTREEFLRGIDIFTKIFGEPPKTFIKHGGHFGHHRLNMVKKEDLSYEGCRPKSLYFVADIIENNFKWVWELHRLFDPLGEPDPIVRFDYEIVYPRAFNFGFWRHRLENLDQSEEYLEELAEKGGVYLGYTHFGYTGLPKNKILGHWIGDDLYRAVEKLAYIIEKYNVRSLTLDEFCGEVVKKYDLRPFCKPNQFLIEEVYNDDVNQ